MLFNCDISECEYLLSDDVRLTCPHGSGVAFKFQGRSHNWHQNYWCACCWNK